MGGCLLTNEFVRHRVLATDKVFSRLLSPLTRYLILLFNFLYKLGPARLSNPFKEDSGGSSRPVLQRNRGCS